MTYRFRSSIKRVGRATMNITDTLLLLTLLNPLIAVMSSYYKMYKKTLGLLQRILRNRDFVVLMLISMIFKMSFASYPIKFRISWSGIINRLL